MKTGDVATSHVLVDASDETEWGTTRDVLMELLYRRACEAGAHISFGASVNSVYDDGRYASLTLASGDTYSADLILAADGIRSRIRPMILADSTSSTDPIVTNTTLYGVKVHSDLITSRSDTKRLVSGHDINIWVCLA